MEQRTLIMSLKCKKTEVEYKKATSTFIHLQKRRQYITDSRQIVNNEDAITNVGVYREGTRRGTNMSYSKHVHTRRQGMLKQITENIKKMKMAVITGNMYNFCRASVVNHEIFRGKSRTEYPFVIDFIF